MKYTKEQIYMYGMRDIAGYEGRYAVTSCGKVWSYSSGQFLTPKVDKYGYYQVGLYDAFGKQHWVLLHRLVAKTYLDNPDNLPDVSHQDECQTHNWLSNLKWATRAENCNMPLHKERISKGNNRQVKCVETGAVFESGKAAAAFIGVNPSCISECINGNQKTAGGYHWERVS